MEITLEDNTLEFLFDMGWSIKKEPNQHWIQSLFLDT